MPYFTRLRLAAALLAGAGALAWPAYNTLATSRAPEPAAANAPAAEPESFTPSDPYQPVGVGPLLQGERGAPPPEGAEAAARMRANHALPGAPEAVLKLATAIAAGAPVRGDDFRGLDPALLSYVFRPHESLDTGGGSLAREAAAMGRVDALRAIGEAGMTTESDDGVLFWSAIELWSPATENDGRAILAQAANELGVHRVHEEGFTAFELAATVSFGAFRALIEYGGNPWTHPLDPQETHGFPSVMERLALHAGAKGALGILEGVTDLPSLPVPSQRAHWNTVGNLIEASGYLTQEGKAPDARRAVEAAERLEARFGPVPAQFWTPEASALKSKSPQNPAEAVAEPAAFPEGGASDLAPIPVP